MHDTNLYENGKYTRTYAHTHMYIYIYISVCVHICECAYARMYPYTIRLCVHTYTYLHPRFNGIIWVYKYSNAFSLIHIQAWIIYIHINIVGQNCPINECCMDINVFAVSKSHMSLSSMRRMGRALALGLVSTSVNSFSWLRWLR